MLSLLVALSNGNALKNNLPRKPAFVDVQPSQPEFKPLAPGDFRQNLLMYVGIEGNLKFWSGHKHSLEGFYLLETSKEKIFLKVISDVYEEKEILANEIANWVYSQGILTSRGTGRP